MRISPAAFALVVLALLAAIACNRLPADPSTPEGAVRVYLEALKAGDVPGAYARLGPQLQTTCKLDTLKPRAMEFTQALDNASVVVRRTRIEADSATVETSINNGRANVGPLGPRSAGNFDQWYRLTKAGDEWRLAEFGWPVYGCPDSRPEKPVEPAATPPPAPAQ